MRATIRQTVVLAVIVGALLARQPAAGAEREIPTGPLAGPTVRLLERALGEPDPGALRRIAQQLDAAELVTALYHGERSERLTALELSAFVGDPWPILPYLAAFMSARERQTASRAASALLDALDRAAADPGGSPDAIAPQARQLAGQLERVALDARLEPDLRASAIAGIQLLEQLGAGHRDPPPALFEDPEEAIRVAALTLFDPPIADDHLALLARLAATDAAITLRGQAAALLCENALAHGVQQPSPDLAALLAQTIRTPSLPAEGVAPILACLRHFPPAARADLVSAAIGNADPRVRAYWEELEQQ